MLIELQAHASMRDIGEADWDGLLGAESAPPHVRWAFLDALETTGCVRPEVGWLPQHLSLREEGKLCAIAPAYVKGNSEGEFVFDHSWAHFCHRNLGEEYFPKLVVAVPFTPATGPRLLCAAEADAGALHLAFARGLRRFVDHAGLSGAHVLFPSEASAGLLESAGLARRCGVQFHWHNPGYGSFDDFLGRFSAKRRHQIRRERRAMVEQGIEITVHRGGDASSDLIDHAYEFYASTVDKHFYGRRYLNREFFHELCARMPGEVLLVMARERGARAPLAGAFNLLGGKRLYGRYWGALEDRPFLHFNVCYYAGIEFCIEHGLEAFEPGAGGEHKHARGFESTLTHSSHLLRDARLGQPVQRFLEQERAAIAESVAAERPILKTLPSDFGAAKSPCAPTGAKD